ncbi:hypothetical protein [Pseudaestuariivita atlantica]|uniref:Uncharacterized protein n=1 Tax=Pseudaestuariivita atlantica TaxID=1317121 RepID=A0A0L1JN48_9RHOB|nr:hypothetical protein [Pseudaestuariivita atlantica]KNG93132.1 hypothetical protein ATO11_14620 [Pseudaestuariivita atlantica]
MVLGSTLLALLAFAPLVLVLGGPGWPNRVMLAIPALWALVVVLVILVAEQGARGTNSAAYHDTY